MFLPSSSNRSQGSSVPESTHALRVPKVGGITILRLLSEQVAIPLDQLARFLGIKLEETLQTVQRLEETGYIARARFLTAGALWVWLTPRGARLAATGFPAKAPQLSSLPHRRALNEVRLYLMTCAPEGRWVCERSICRSRSFNHHFPDAVFEINGERHAIEVELTRKANFKLAQVIAEHSARYDAIVYFCGHSTLSVLERFQAENSSPKLLVRPLPTEEPALWSESSHTATPALLRANTVDAFRPHAISERGPYLWELEILRLFSEQGGIPLDQLARFLNCSPLRAQQVVSHLATLSYVQQSEILVDEPPWIWLTHLGSRLSGTGFNYMPAIPGRLPLMRAINEVRLAITQSAPDARWLSGRALAHGPGKRGRTSVPSAVVEINGERHAIEVRVWRAWASNLVPIIDRRCAQYDAVIFFCATPSIRRLLQRLQAQYHWSKLIIRDLP